MRCYSRQRAKVDKVVLLAEPARTKSVVRLGQSLILAEQQSYRILMLASGIW